MAKNNISQFFTNISSTVTKHSPEILMGFGIAGMITSTVLAVKATPKALRLIERAEEEKGKKLTKTEVIKTTWKCYIPTVLVAATSTGCLIGSSRVNLRRNAMLATAYKIAETTHKEYRDKVIETIGEKKEQVIKDKIAEDKLNANPVNNNTIIITDNGNTLFCDTLSKRYFRSDRNKIEKAQNEINRKLNIDLYASLNDFYELIGLEYTDMGDDLGWNIANGLLELDLRPALATNGEPCLAIEYNLAPKYDYSSYM